MAACEDCWTEATVMAHMRGGFAADYYRDVLAKNEGYHTTPPDEATTNGERA